MTGQELASALATIGWSGRALAGRLGCDEKLVRLWLADRLPTPPPIGRWLASVAKAIDRLPVPDDWRK